MSAVAEAPPHKETLPAAFETLASRYDPTVIDLPREGARIQLSIAGGRDWYAFATGHGVTFSPEPTRHEPNAVLTADERTWDRIAADVRGGMDAFRARRLKVRQNLHLGVGFLAATSGITEPGRLRFHSVQTRRERISVLEAGVGEDTTPILCLHGLGGTKASFLSTVAALADSYRVIAADLPGFGDSDKPIGAAYDAPYFSRAVARLMDAMEIERAHLIGNSMGGRIAIEVGLREPDRAERIVLLSPALAWLRRAQWEWILQLARPRLGLIQPAPRAIVEPLVRRMVPGGNDGWAAAGVDEFLRAFLTPSGRAAFYAAGRNILLDPPEGEDGLWTRLRELSPETMFVWGRRDQLVPIGFMKHVEEALPAARHVELDCGHVPQMERPRETHRAIRDFLA
jgi:pimeloyl-ACP methyl ester carboxylesterase